MSYGVILNIAIMIEERFRGDKVLRHKLFDEKAV